MNKPVISYEHTLRDRLEYQVQELGYSVDFDLWGNWTIGHGSVLDPLYTTSDINRAIGFMQGIVSLERHFDVCR